ncbi:hypothetical protein J2T18_000610 [Paenibacillus polymyxa]|nr:hypothetical protein [Paenibacillus polymyxa]
MAILEAGKHVYSKKPLAVSLEDDKRVLDLAKAKNLRVGCAPETFLGAGIQTARHAIQTGMIGQPVAAGAGEMVRAIRSEKNHRDNAELAYHVLEAMHAFQRSSLEGNHITMESTFKPDEDLYYGTDIMGN